MRIQRSIIYALCACLLSHQSSSFCVRYSRCPYHLGFKLYSLSIRVTYPASHLLMSSFVPQLDHSDSIFCLWHWLQSFLVHASFSKVLASLEIDTVNLTNVSIWNVALAPRCSFADGSAYHYQVLWFIDLTLVVLLALLVACTLNTMSSFISWLCNNLVMSKSTMLHLLAWRITWSGVKWWGISFKTWTATSIRLQLGRETVYHLSPCFESISFIEADCIAIWFHS